MAWVGGWLVGGSAVCLDCRIKMVLVAVTVFFVIIPSVSLLA